MQASESRKQLSSADEADRLHALYEYDILDSRREAGFDNLTKLASQIFNLPYVFITFVDRHRVWFKSAIGLDAIETPRGSSFCESAILETDVYEVFDAQADERFLTNPLVTGPPHFRYYIGVPLINENGFALGALCLLDTIPKRMDDDQREMLKTIAAEVMMHLSERKKAIALQRETQRLEAMLNISAFSPEIHAVLDFKGKIMFINGAVKTLLGYSVEEALGLNLWDICCKEDMQLVLDTLHKGLAVGECEFEILFRILRKDGASRWFSWSLVKKNRTWYAYGRDHTERRKVQSELMRLSLVASKVNNAVVINDHNNEVVWINDAFEKITGFSLEDIRGQRLGDLLAGPGTDLERIQRARELSKRNQSFTIDVLCYRKDKEPIWLSVYNTMVLDESGKVEMEVEIIIDITEKKLAERELMDAKEKALQLSASKEMFLSVMSHEIRNPLNAVIGMTHLLLENDPKPSQLEDLKILKFSGENLIHIINDVLDYTKIETGNLELEVIPFSLETLVNDILNSLQVNGKKNNNQLELIYDPKIPQQLMGDKNRLYQILMNLLGNAIKFTQQGTVTLKAQVAAVPEMAVQPSLVELAAAGPEHQARRNSHIQIDFEVSDTGIGIAEDKQAYIFESFTQARTDISRKYGGTGLGLAITRKLLSLLNSDIHVQSKEGQGTTFFFSIVFDMVDHKKIEASLEKQSEAFKGKKVLVVDDNEINILIVKRILTTWGLENDVAADGKEAISKVLENRYDLILMDINMPGIDGFETTSIIRELQGQYYQEVPVIALTASTQYHDSSKISASGMNGYLLKPFNHDKVKSVLSEFLGEHTN
jgi:PAS domain S-box-containing protein